MCRGCLPTRVRLQDKGVQCMLSCVTCDAPSEDLNHVFFDFSFAVQVWHQSGLWDVIQHVLSLTTTTAGAIFHLLHELSRENSQRFTATIWSLWKHRNLKPWQEISETVVQVIDCVVRLLEDWNRKNAQAATTRNPCPSQQVDNSAVPTNTSPWQVPAAVHDFEASSSNSETRQLRWQPPPRGRVKCNIDASFFDQLNRTGGSIFIHDIYLLE